MAITNNTRERAKDSRFGASEGVPVDCADGAEFGAHVANCGTDGCRVSGVSREPGGDDPSGLQCRNSRSKAVCVPADECDGEAFRAELLGHGGRVAGTEPNDHDGFDMLSSRRAVGIDKICD
ncbi:MAG TPA: hypothetical protein VME66_06440 [Candidatus Acidoferrales bacterium]|nr:hypothetical protein [Candidatus Acidoferrales bacterium]